jgi:exonuclease III
VFLVGEASRSNKRRNLTLGTWNVRSLYWTGSIAAVARELARDKLDVVGVQEVRWDKEGTVKAGNYSFFFYGMYGGGEGCARGVLSYLC